MKTLKQLLSELTLPTHEKEVDLITPYTNFTKKINLLKSNFIKKFERSIKNAFINKKIIIRAKKSNTYSPEQEYTIQVKNAVVSSKGDDYIIILKDNRNVSYYLSTEFNPRILSNEKDSSHIENDVVEDKPDSEEIQ